MIPKNNPSLIDQCRLLNQAIVEVIADERNIPSKLKGKLESIFIERLFEVLSLSFDLSLEKNAFLKFVERQKHTNNVMSMMKFVLASLETESTYVLINYYQVSFINTLSNLFGRGASIRFDQKIEALGVTSNLIDSVVQRYNDLRALRMNRYPNSSSVQ